VCDRASIGLIARYQLLYFLLQLPCAAFIRVKAKNPIFGAGIYCLISEVTKSLEVNLYYPCSEAQWQYLRYRRCCMNLRG